MKNALNWVLWAFQMLFMLVAMVLFYWPARLLFAIGRALRDNLGQSLMRGPYYWLSVQRRKLRGEPLWQEHDLMLGIMSPEMVKAMNEAGPLMGPVGQMVPGPVPIMKPPTNAEVVQNLRRQAEEWSAKAEEISKLPPDERFLCPPLEGTVIGRD